MREPEGLRQPRGKAGVSVGRRQRLASGRQKDEHWRVCAPRGANFSGQPDPVHLGHLVIEKCHVEGIPLYDPFESHGGRVCIPGEHAPSLGLQLQQKTIAGIVVDDQNALPASSGCSPWAAARSNPSTSSAMIVKWHVEPFPGSLSAQIRPPTSSLSRLLIARPQPVPPPPPALPPS